VRRVLVNLRDAAAHRDWAYMMPAFPSEGAITERVRGVVTGGLGSGGLSFWTPTATPDFTKLALAPVKEDLVAISIPFIDNGNPGSFGAVFERQAGEWRLTCFQEAFPAKPMEPGCVPYGPAPQ
jgi:hypothetical protein